MGGGVGLGVGFHLGMKSGILMGSTVEYEWFHRLSKVVLSEGDCEDVKQALESYLAMIEKQKDSPDSFISGAIAYADIVVAHARLARVEQKLGNAGSARWHIELAIEACDKAGWKECSEEKIFSISKSLENNLSIPCIQEEK